MDMLSYFLGNIANENSGGGVSVQADYNQNNPNAADYIKNRPFYEIPSPFSVNLNTGSDEDEIQIYTVQGKLGISPDKQYCLIAKVGEAEEEAEVFCFYNEEIGLNVLCLEPELDDEYTFLYDGYNYETGEMGDYYSYGTQFFSSLDSVALCIKGEIKKIDKKFLPDDIATKLEIATPDILGGVQPVAKNDSMTQEVGIDEDGRLYTEPGSQEYTLPVASSTSLGGIYTTQTYNENKHTLNTAMVNDKLYVEKPSIAEAVTEDPGIAPSCAAVYTFIENCFKEATY